MDCWGATVATMSSTEGPRAKKRRMDGCGNGGPSLEQSLLHHVTPFPVLRNALPQSLVDLLKGETVYNDHVKRRIQTSFSEFQMLGLLNIVLGERAWFTVQTCTVATMQPYGLVWLVFTRDRDNSEP